MDKATLATEVSKYFENELKKIGASGRGLRERAESIRTKLQPGVIDALKKVARERNKVVHETAEGWDETSFLLSALQLAGRLGPSTVRAASPTHQLPAVGESTGLLTLADESSKNEEMPHLTVLTTDQVATILMAKPYSLSEDDLEELIDDANEKAMRQSQSIYERWDAFQFLAHQEGCSLGEKLDYFALAVKAGALVPEIVANVIATLPMEFLVKEFLLLRDKNQLNRVQP